jgi:hypothetical protein
MRPRKTVFPTQASTGQYTADITAASPAATTATSTFFIEALHRFRTGTFPAISLI